MPVGAFCAFLGFWRLVRYFTLFLGHAEIGRIPIENAAAIAPDGQPQERLYSLCHMELALLTGVSLSYRKGLELLNRLLRRGAENRIKFRLCALIG